MSMKLWTSSADEFQATVDDGADGSALALRVTQRVIVGALAASTALAQPAQAALGWNTVEWTPPPTAVVDETEVPVQLLRPTQGRMHLRFLSGTPDVVGSVFIVDEDGQGQTIPPDPIPIYIPDPGSWWNDVPAGPVPVIREDYPEVRVGVWPPPDRSPLVARQGMWLTGAFGFDMADPANLPLPPAPRSPLQPARQTYTQRAVPADPLHAFLTVEHQNIARAIPPVGTRTVATNTTTTALDDFVLVDPSAGPITVTLLDPARVLNQLITIKQINSASHPVTLKPVIGLIDDATTYVLAGINRSVTLQSNGVNYYVKSTA